jgi:SAM-dependent methyltransferase
MDWEQHYLDEHTPWDKGAAAPPLLEWIEVNPDAISGRVLVPGCGLGHDCRALASETGAENVIGIDISPEAVKRAEQEEKTGTERYEVADLFDLEREHRESNDWIWEHTCFCAIEPELRDAYVEAVHGALKPGGNLLAVFYLDPYDEEHPRGGGPPHGCSLEELEQRFVKSGRFEELESYVPEKAYVGREGLERVIRYRRIG